MTMTIYIPLKHGESGKQDVSCHIKGDVLTLREPCNQSEYPEDVVTLDRWQMRKLLAVLQLWDEEQP